MAGKKRKKSQRGSLIIIGLLIIILSIVLVKYVTNKDIYLKIDGNAIKEEENVDKMEVSPGGGAVSLEYSNQIVINKTTKEISMYLKNPSKSRENISIEIYIKGSNKEILVGESKLIPTGYSIKKLTLTNEEINEGEYKGFIKVFFYNEKTSEKEIIDSKINVEIKID